MSIKYVSNPQLSTIKKGYPGNINIDGEFSNSTVKDINSFSTVLKWRFTRNPQREEKQKENYALEVLKNTDFLNGKDDRIVWLGHSSFFIKIDGVSILTDPVFFDLPFIKRQASLPCPPEKFKNIDYLILSHGHRDHFDEKSLRIVLSNNPSIKILGPLEISTLYKSLQYNGDIQEAGWYQKFKTQSTEAPEFVFLPAKHWHRRGLNDFNKVLWGSFLIKGKNTSIYFAGDTAYGNHFKEIQQTVQQIDYCLMPIGAYKPSFMMQAFHVNPEEAFKAYNDLNAKYFIPMHYGTYDLADEPLGEPESEIRRLFKERGNSRYLLIEPIGKPILI